MISIKSRSDFSSSISYNNSTNSSTNESNLYANPSGMSNVDNGSISSHLVHNSTANQQNAYTAAMSSSSSSANDDLKEKKRKMMLPLSGPGSAGSAQSTSNGTTPNESKRAKILVTPNVANYVQDTLDLSTSNMLTTPQLERFITELGTNPTLLKTPDSALGLLTPATSSLFFGLGTTPMNGNVDPSSAYANMQGQSSATLGSNLLNNRGMGLTPNYGNVNPSDIFMNAANQQQQQQQQQQASGNSSMDYLNNSSKYAVLTTVSDGSSASMMNMQQAHQNENMVSGGGMHLNNVNNDMNNTGDYKLVKLGAKDEPQTVPVSSKLTTMNGHMNTMADGGNSSSASWSTNGQSTSTKKRNNSTSGKSKSGGKKAAPNEPVQQQQQPLRLNHIIQPSEPMSMSSSRHDLHSNASSVASSMSMMNESSYSPADPDKNKVEKKRERNREAARKCRTRKLEKIAELTLQVKELTNSNEIERAKTLKLSQEIEELKQKMRQHKNAHGCDLNVNI